MGTELTGVSGTGNEVEVLGTGTESVPNPFSRVNTPGIPCTGTTLTQELGTCIDFVPNLTYKRIREGISAVTNTRVKSGRVLWPYRALTPVSFVSVSTEQIPPGIRC